MSHTVNTDHVRIKHIGNISGVAWDFHVNEKKTSLTFKSNAQIEHRNCSFEICGMKCDDWSIRVSSYNDFGREYKHIAQKNNQESNS